MSRCPELACLYPLYQDPVSKLYVFAGHPDRILPRELSARLMGTFGIGNFRISLQRNVYVVYICDTSDSGLGIKTLKKQTYKERSRDVRNAQKALMGTEGALAASRMRRV